MIIPYQPLELPSLFRSLEGLGRREGARTLTLLVQPRGFMYLALNVPGVMGTAGKRPANCTPLHWVRINRATALRRYTNVLSTINFDCLTQSIQAYGRSA